MRRIAAVLTAATLSFGGLTAVASPAHACVGVQCTVDCVRRVLSGSRVCPD
jgi:hypothetical protein